MSLLDDVRVSILAGRAEREAEIASKRTWGMSLIEEASMDEVLLFQQLQCDVEGKHDFEDHGDRHVCKNCGWIQPKVTS